VPAFLGDCADLLLDAVQVQPGERVLDVACGTGVVARLAAQRVGHTVQHILSIMAVIFLSYVITGYTAVDRSYTWHFSAAVPFILW